MGELVERSLLDLVESIVDNRGRTCPTSSDGIPLIATNCLKDGKRDVVYENLRFVDEDTYKNWFRGHPEPRDVLFVCKGSPGRVAVVPDPVPYCIAQDMVALRANAATDPGYLYYRLRSPDVQLGIQNMHVGTMIPHFKKGDFGRLTFLVHSNRSAQQAIAEVLGALDDKIAANEHVLASCRALVAAEFDAALASGSRAVILADIAEFHNRRRVPLSSRERETRHGKVPYYGAAGRLDFVDESLFDEALVLVGEDGSVVNDDGSPVVQYIWGPSWVNNHAHVLTGASLATETLHCALNRANVAHLVTGAVQPKISMGNLKRLEICLPADIGAMDDVAIRYAATVRAVSEEDYLLVRTRDRLLPLLMSGRVTVKAAAQIVGEVT